MAGYLVIPTLLLFPLELLVGLSKILPSFRIANPEP